MSDESRKSFGVSDVVWQALIGGIVTCVLAYMTHQNKLALEKNRESADEHAATQAKKLTAVETAITSVNQEMKKNTEVAKETTEATRAIPVAAAKAADVLIQAKTADKPERE